MLGAEIAAFLSAYSVAAIVLDACDCVTYANAAASNLFGSSAVLPGCSVRELLPEWPILLRTSQSVLQDDKGHRQSCRVRVVKWPTETETTTAILIEAEGDEIPVELAAHEAHLRLQYVIDMLPHAMCVFDARDRYVLWNQKYADLYADIADHLRPGIAFEDILKISLASGRMQEIVLDKGAWLRERMIKFRQPTSQEEQQLHDGRWLRHDDRRTPDGGAIGMRIDITDLKQREDWLRQLFDANPMPMLLCDGSSLAILEANRSAIDFYGFEKIRLLSKTVADMHASDDVSEFTRRLRDLTGDCEARTVWRQYTADGRERHVLIYVRILYERSDRRLLLTIADVSDRVLAEAEANRLAHHDVLTGLPNRMRFYKALDEALSNSGSNVVVYCLDLDGFKPVNDTFGHAAGDEVLKLVAERLRSETQGHMVARLGGDEFSILVMGTEEVDVDLARRCIAAFDRPFLIRGIQISLGISIGIAKASTDGRDGEALVQAADRALYRAKADGRNTWRMSGDDHARIELVRA